MVQIGGRLVKHAVIFAHPKAESFTGSVANAYAEAAVALGHQVVKRDLYRMNFDPCLREDELPFASGAHPRPDVIAERQLLADVNIFVLIYPFWLNAPPAILTPMLLACNKLVDDLFKVFVLS